MWLTALFRPNDRLHCLQVWPASHRLLAQQRDRMRLTALFLPTERLCCLQVWLASEQAPHGNATGMLELAMLRKEMAALLGAN